MGRSARKSKFAKVSRGLKKSGVSKLQDSGKLPDKLKRKKRLG